MRTFSEKLAFVERALWEGVQPRPENRTVIEPNWVQLTTPQAPTPYLNGVYRCEIDDDSITERVKQTARYYQALKLPFRWKICPSSKPAHLPSLLRENGLQHKETLFGLIAEPGLSIQSNPAISIQPLSLGNLEDWLEVQKLAWETPPPGILHLRKTQTEALRSGSSGSDAFLNFIAYQDGVPCGSGGLRFYQGYSCLIGAAVNPAHRKTGVYRALLDYRMKRIRERGVPAVVHCLETTSAPICLKLGFEKVCEIQSYESSPFSG